MELRLMGGLPTFSYGRPPLQMFGSETESTNYSCCSHNILVVIIVCDEEEGRLTRVAQLKINLLPDGWLRRRGMNFAKSFSPSKSFAKRQKLFWRRTNSEEIYCRRVKVKIFFTRAILLLPESHMNISPMFNRLVPLIMSGTFNSCVQT